MLAALLCLAMLPIAFLQTRVLFNSVYAGALDTIAARRHLESYVYSQINLAGLWRLCLSIGQQSVEVLGWVLGLFGLRQVVTGLLRRTWCWRYFEAPVRRNALPRTPAWQTPGRYSRQVLSSYSYVRTSPWHRSTRRTPIVLHDTLNLTLTLTLTLALGLTLALTLTLALALTLFLTGRHDVHRAPRHLERPLRTHHKLCAPASPCHRACRAGSQLPRQVVRAGPSPMARTL